MNDARCDAVAMQAHRPGRPKGTGRRAALLVAATLVALALPACTTEGDTLIVNGLDCGLIHLDVSGDWVVTYTPDAAILVNCYDPSWNDTVIDVPGFSTLYPNPVSYASPSGASFNIVGMGPNNRPNELLASVEADSCLALVQTWEEDDQGWVQCFGTMDLTTNLIAGICDSFDLDTDADGVADVACDLDHSLLAAIATPP
jgi:hypothetical protein